MNNEYTTGWGMTLAELCMLASSLANAGILLQQLQHNKNKKSIYGLSYDFIIITWISYLCKTIATINYGFSEVLIGEYKKRFPVHSTVSISWVVFVIDLLSSLILTGIVFQLRIYRRTRNVNQGISFLPITYFVGSTTTLFLMIKWCLDNNQKTINYLDIIDFLWFQSNFLSGIQLVPQLYMNWFDSCVVGTFHNFVWLKLGQLIILAVGKLHTFYYQDWFDIPLNYDTWGTFAMNSFVISILIYQQFYIYHGNKPTLVLQHHKLNKPSSTEAEFLV